MNRKGFTLIEVLAVIVILAILLVFTAPYIITAYEDSKLKSEEIFIKRLSQSIDSYVKLYSSDSSEMTFSEDGTANKKHNSTENGNEGETSYQVDIYKSEISVQKIIDKNIITKNNYISPGNKEISCNTNATIEIYKDSDFVYCQKVDASSLNCLTEKYIKSICPEQNGTCYVIDTCIWSR